ncbi:MAG: dTDP-4-dehydrorhamnose 3,5-epimerase family protein [Mycobacterium sp.]|uniref:dTDP-4-dehydrorhamnose 3,5-epimerase family protein n=1 Tax=Mycobacterium sp. TaxID=1785 RepID=UPI003CC513E0
MRYTPTAITGVTIVDVEPHYDDRGFSSRAFCVNEFAEYGLISNVAQTNIFYNHKRGTVRGLHLQAPPYPEAKLVRCTRGAIVDVAVDVRRESSTYGRHVMTELSADNHRALFLTPYVAHGFQTLADNTEVLYQVSGRYAPAGQQGFRWDEPAFKIPWPLTVTVVSEEDAKWPLLEPVGIAARAQGLLPIGAAKGCTLVRDVPRDATPTYDDVQVPLGRLVEQLLEAQSRMPVGVQPDLAATT